tara:strand:+ start:24676 stop:24882 length:207 start_codon:yes stop_codon:yes gene_type:complete
MIKVEGHSNLYRDSKTGAIINTDDVEYNRYIKLIKSDSKKEKEMKKMKNDIEEIKEALSEIINNLKKN